MTIDDRSRSTLRMRRGATLVLVAVMMIPLFAVLGIAMDIGNAYRQKRIAQTAADAGALSAAWERYRGFTKDSMIVSGQREAARNGFADGVAGVTVLVDSTPTEGRFQSQTAKYAQVTITTSVQTRFAALFGFNSFAVRARAVAGLTGSSSSCIYVTSDNASPALLVETDADVVGQGCAVSVKSTASDALLARTGGELQAASISVVGGAQTCTGCVSPTPTTGATLGANPLAYLSMPTVPSGCDYTGTKGQYEVKTAVTLSPGTFCGGLNVNGGSAVATMTPGTYFMVDGGLIVEGKGKLIGTGVTIVNTFKTSKEFGPIIVRTDGVVNLSGATSGPLAGIVFFEDPSAPSGFQNKFETGSGSTISGSFNFPVNNVIFQTKTDLTISGGIVANTLDFKTGGTVTFTGFGGAGGSKKVSLVE